MSSSPLPFETLGYDGSPVSLPALSMPHTKLLSDAYAICMAAVRNEDAASGEWVYHSTQEEVEIFTKKPLAGSAGSSVNCSKGIGFIDASPLLVSTLFNTVECRHHWDAMHERGEQIECFDPFTVQQYNSFKAPWPVSGRDFVAIGRTAFLPPRDVPALNSNESTGIGAAFTFITNCENAKMPPVKGLVRGVLHFCGFYVEAVPGNPNRSKVIYTLGSDPCGSIPKTLVNALTVKQPLCIAAMRNVLKKNAKLVTELEEKVESNKLKFKEWRSKNGQEGAAASVASKSMVAETAAAPAVSESVSA